MLHGGLGPSSRGLRRIGGEAMCDIYCLALRIRLCTRRTVATMIGTFITGEGEGQNDQ